ncbi:unnamed protein product [Cochlearia groenlandica]
MVKKQVWHRNPKRINGIVIWIDASSFLAGLSCIVKDGDATIFTKSELSGKGLALRWAMEVAILKGFRNATFRSDCLQLINLVEGSFSITSLYRIVADIKALSIYFDHFDVVFILRSLNEEADALAK